MARPTRLRAEHLDHPLGLGEPRPRLSWRLPAGATRQIAYELRSSDDSTVHATTDACVLVPWPGRPLASGERRSVEVRVWTDAGESDWSEPLVVEAGLLNPEDWRAAWISPRAAEAPAGKRPVYRLRGAFEVDRAVSAARLYVTAHGLVEPWLDGERVSLDELTPGYTEYGDRTQVATYDVTRLLTPGRHVLGAYLADGWYRGQVGLIRAHDQWGDTTALLAQLHIDYADGGGSTIVTGEDWLWSPSHILAADLIEGQFEDRRLAEPGWSTPAYDASGWAPVTVVERGHFGLVSSPAPPVRPVEEIRPVSVTRIGPDRHVADLGQNINGRVRLSDLGPAGTDITLTHGESLGPDRDVTTDHLRPDVPFLPHPLAVGQVDRVISAGIDGNGFDPRFTTHGFRYVRIDGHPGPLTPDDLVGVVVHTDLEPRGSFACDDDRIGRLHDAAVWSFRGNACDIPTDCPTRERAGWTGDWQLYVPTASYLYDVAGFSIKWLRDLAGSQWADGTLGNMAPMPRAERTGFLEKVNGSAGWGDAIVLVPWELYAEYGDADVLRDMWPHMVAWLDRTQRMAETERHPDRIARRPDPAPHERYLWDTGFHWGEWLEPGAEPTDFPAFIAADKAEVATAFYAWSTRHAAAIAQILGRNEDARRYADLNAKVADAWRAEFVVDGHVTPRTQANLVRALAFDLLTEDLRQTAADDLADLVRAAGTHLGTGFLATPDLLPVLADHGHLDLAYELLFQDTSPSWLTMIDRGATTVWERWDGVDEDGTPHESLNHYSKGAVISFLHRYVAGLRRVEPTWRRFEVRPRPGGSLRRARTEHVTPHGTAAVSWVCEGDALAVEVTVPPGSVADVVLPDGTTHQAGPGVSEYRA